MSQGREEVIVYLTVVNVSHLSVQRASLVDTPFVLCATPHWAQVFFQTMTGPSEIFTNISFCYFVATKQ